MNYFVCAFFTSKKKTKQKTPVSCVHSSRHTFLLLADLKCCLLSEMQSKFSSQLKFDTLVMMSRGLDGWAGGCKGVVNTAAVRFIFYCHTTRNLNNK